MDLLLHIGLPKTGTTFLQKQFLPNLNDISCFIKPQLDLSGKNKQQTNLGEIFERSPVIWDELGNTIFSSLDLIKKTKIILVSDEDMGVKPNRFTHRRFEGSFWRNRSRDAIWTKLHLLRFYDLAKRSGFKTIKIMVTIRRQDRQMASFYSQESGRLVGASQDHFERCVSFNVDPYKGYYYCGIALDYNRLYHEISQVVGSSNLLMLPFELLEQKPFFFLERWLKFMNIHSSNKTILENLIDQKHNVNKFAYDKWIIKERIKKKKEYTLRPARIYKSIGIPHKISIPNFDFGRGKQIELTSDLKKQILARYQESNQKLENKVGIQLSQYGYCNIPK